MLKKRIIALTMAMVLLLGMLSGCGVAESASASEVQQSEVSAEASVAVPEEEPVEAVTEEADEIPSAVVESAVEEPVQEVIDYSQGLTFTDYPLVDEPATLTLWVSFQTNMYGILPNGFEDHSTYKLAEELTGVNIDFLHQSVETQDEQFNLMIASGDYPDMVSRMEYNGGFDAAVNDEFAVDLTPYIEEYAPNFNYLIHMNDDAYIKDIVTDDGNIVAFYVFNSEPSLTGNGAIVRVDWLNELGLEKPETYDELHDALAMFKSEFGAEEALMLPASSVPNGNFLVGGYGVAGQQTATLGMVTYPYYVEDGVVKHGLVEDGYYDYVCMIREWMEEGLISETYLTDNDNPMGDAYTINITTGRSGVVFNDTPMIADYQRVGEENDPDFLVEACNDFVLNAGDTVKVANANSVLGNAGITITTGCEDIPLAVQWNDFLYSEEMTVVQNWGEEGVSFEYDENGNKVVTDLINNPPEGYSTMQMNYVYTNTTANKIDNIAKKTLTYTQAQLDANDIWNSNRDSSNMLPNSLQLNADESEQHSAIYSDIDTYVSENLAKFYSGDKPLSEWDAFIETVHEMGIDECIEIYQGAYDRYMAK